MAAKDNLLVAIKGNDITVLMQCVKELSVDGLNDALAGFSRRLLQELWDSVQSMFVQALKNTEMDCAATGELILCISRLANATLTSQEGYDLFLPPSLIEVAVLVHGIFPSLGAEHASIKDGISRLFESWWLKEGHGREELMGNTLVYLLTKSMGPKATKSDVARVYAVCRVLDSVNFDSDSASALMELLLQCCVLPQFLNSSQGIKFLAYLLTLNPELTKMLHQAIKNRLPATPMSWHTKYSEVYLKAWQDAKNPMREVIEHQCIQDLMYRAVHAQRSGRCSITKVLFRVLGAIHKKKTQKGVEAMLTRLYEPILWRSLMAANSDVRINAAVLMFDAFPLQNADLNRQQADAALQKQFDIIHSLLSDPVPEVRMVAVQGVGRVLNIYWELIPADVIKCFVTKLIEDLAYDVSSPAVREAVVKAMHQLCDNHLCIPMLQNVLPLLRNFVHDTSEKVRVAMFDLLLKVKGLRAIKFWNLVPLEHILSRLQMDSAPVVRRIMKLIHPSFVPLQEPAEEQVQRCVTLVKLNMSAARQFYLNLPRSLSLEDTIQYITLLCRTLIESARKLNGRSAQSPHDDASTSRNDSVNEEETSKTRSSKPNRKLRKTGTTQSETVGLSDSDEEDRAAADDELADMAVFRGLVEAVYLMHSVVLNELDTNTSKESLAKKLSVMVREVMAVSKDPHLDAALVALASHLPSRALPHIAQNLFKRLKSGSCFDGSIDLKLMVKSLVLWGKARSVIQLVQDSFESIFKHEKDSTSADNLAGPKKSKPAKKAVAFVTVEEPKISPDLACALIMNMITPAECRHILLTNHRQDLKALVDSLIPTMDELDAYFTRRKQMSKRDVDIFVEVHTIFLRLTAFLCARNEAVGDNVEETDDEVVQLVNRSILWCCRFVTSYVNDEAADCRDLSISLLTNVTKVCRNLMMIGLNNPLFLEATVDLLQAVLREPGVCFSLQRHVLQAVYQLTQVLKYKKLPSKVEKSALLDDLGCRSIDCVLTSLTKLAISNEDKDGEENEEDTNDELEEQKSQGSTRISAQEKLPALTAETVETMMELTAAEVNLVVIDKLVGSILKFVLADSKAAKGHETLPPFTNSLLRIFQKRDILKKSFCDQLQTCLDSERVTTISQIKGLLHVLELLASDLSDSTLAALYKSLDNLLGKIPTASSSEKEFGDVKKMIEEKLNKTPATNVETAA